MNNPKAQTAPSPLLRPQRLEAERERDSVRPQFAQPILRFTPTAWAKLLFLARCGETEVGGFGIATGEDPLLIGDFALVKQSCTVVSVALDDHAVADFFEQQVDQGRRPEQFARVWVHTHPGNSAQPSGTDEATFSRVFGSCHWAVMFIIARGGQTYARLRFNVGPGGEVGLPVQVDYSQPFDASDFVAWKQEYLAKVQPECLMPEAAKPGRPTRVSFDDLDAQDLERMSAQEWREWAIEQYFGGEEAGLGV